MRFFLAVAAVVVAPAVAAIALRKTWAWWIGGAAAAGVAAYLFATMGHTAPLEDAEELVLAPIDNFVPKVCGGVMCAYAVLLLACAWRARKRAR